MGNNKNKLLDLEKEHKFPIHIIYNMGPKYNKIYL